MGLTGYSQQMAYASEAIQKQYEALVGRGLPGLGAQMLEAGEQHRRDQMSQLQGQVGLLPSALPPAPIIAPPPKKNEVIEQWVDYGRDEFVEKWSDGLVTRTKRDLLESPFTKKRKATYGHMEERKENDLCLCTKNLWS